MVKCAFPADAGILPEDVIESRLATSFATFGSSGREGWHQPGQAAHIWQYEYSKLVVRHSVELLQQM